MNPESILADITPLAPDLRQRTQEVSRLLELSQSAAKRERGPSGAWDVATGQGIVFSAPHEVTHFRDGVEKTAEQGTGPLALALARYTGGIGITTAAEQDGDPNWDIDHPYIERVDNLAASSPTIDLHMMRPRGVDVCIGLGPVPLLTQGLWPVFVEEAAAAGLRVSLNWPFWAGPRSVTGQLQARGRKAIQLELTWECFDPAHLAMARSWSFLARAARRLARMRTSSA